MILKNTLTKPCTDTERADFIVANNHTLGYEIRETDTELQAWGADDTELLASAKINKLSSLRSIRNSKDALPVTTSLGSFDFDSVSQSRIRNAITITTGTRSWTLADGTTIQVTATDLQNVIAAGAERSDTLHNTYLSLKAQVAAATTVAEVEAIVWPS